MMNIRRTIDLKGQLILAQGNPPVGGVALGWKMGVKIVRAITFCKGLSLFRTKMHQSYSVRNRFFAMIIVFARTVFFLSLLPQTLSGARINWPFRPKFELGQIS